jgi:hypothetical protein
MGRRVVQTASRPLEQLQGLEWHLGLVVCGCISQQMLESDNYSSNSPFGKAATSMRSGGSGAACGCGFWRSSLARGELKCCIFDEE